MAGTNPRVGARVVPLDLTVPQVEILREDLLSWLYGINQDLRYPDRLRDPGATVREGQAFRRLLSALDSDAIELPDEEARRSLERAARGFDHASGYDEISPTHDAHRALLDVLDQERAR